MSDEDGKPALDPSDLQSHAWHKLRLHMEARLATLRLKNDNQALDATATAALRGEIKAYRNFLALANPSPEVVADEQPD